MIVDKGPNLLLCQTRVPSLGKDDSDPIVEHRLSLGQTNVDRGITHHHPATTKRLDHPIGGQLIKGAGDRVGIERDLITERANARKQLAGTDGTGCDRKFDLPDKL